VRVNRSNDNPDPYDADPQAGRESGPAWPSAGRTAAAPAASAPDGAIDTLDRAPGAPGSSGHGADPATGVAPAHESIDDLPPQQQWMAGGAGTGESKYGNIRLALLVVAVVAGAIWFGPYVFIIIGGLLVSIVLHEFGHYWTAKKCGMKATEFFVGFGPRLWSVKRGETEYGIKPIPAGAYVKIIGMNDFEEVDPADEERTYRHQSAPKRMAVVLAGPFMNLLIFFVLMTGVFYFHGAPLAENWTSTRTDWTVDTVQPGSSAAAAGLRTGDKIVSVGGEQATTFDNFKSQIDAKAGTQVPVVVLRDGQQVTLTPTLGWRFNKEAAGVIASKPALTTADVVLTADGAPLVTYDQLRTVLAQEGAPVTLRIERAGHKYDLDVPRPVALPADGSAGYFGVKPEVPQVSETAAGALGETGRTFGSVATGMFSGFGRLFSPSGASEYVSQFTPPPDPSSTQVAVQPNVMRPVDGAPSPEAATSTGESVRPISIVGIVQVGTGAAESGLWSFLALLALVNLALALINLLPVLPFDGGHAVIAAYEGIRGLLRGERYHADLTKMMPIVYGVFGVLILLGGSAVLLDLMHPVQYGP
jgi:RIP metalloprotease RseP